MKLTPWFHGSIKPVRVGVYQRDYGKHGGIVYCYFDGILWHGAAAELCFVSKTAHSLSQYMPWRGVLK